MESILLMKTEKVLRPMPFVTRPSATYGTGFIHVVNVPPPDMAIDAYVQEFDIPAPLSMLQKLEKAEDWALMKDIARGDESVPVMSIGARVSPQPLRGVPDSSFPMMLFYQPHRFVVALYTKKTEDVYALQWFEVIPFLCPLDLFPQPPFPSDRWIKKKDGLVTCKVNATQVLKEKWTWSEKPTKRLFFLNAKKTMGILVGIRTATRCDDSGKDTGEPITYYIDRKYGIYEFTVVMDKEHAAPIQK